MPSISVFHQSYSLVFSLDFKFLSIQVVKWILIFPGPVHLSICSDWTLLSCHNIERRIFDFIILAWDRKLELYWRLHLSWARAFASVNCFSANFRASKNRDNVTVVGFSGKITSSCFDKVTCPFLVLTRKINIRKFTIQTWKFYNEAIYKWVKILNVL